MFTAMRKHLADTLAEVRNQPLEALLKNRYQRLMNYGRYKDDK
jgi:acetyl-CoA carboxylase carboxyl transferase subunit alpha